MAATLRTILEEARIPLAELSRGAGVDYRDLKRWASGTATPSQRSWAAMNEWLSEKNLSLPAPDPDAPAPRSPRRQRRASTPAPSPESTLETRFREYLSPAELRALGLSADPFEDPETPDQLWMSTALADVDAEIRNAIRRRQVLAICADPGAGKSSLIRRLYAELGSHPRVKLISPAGLDRRRIGHAAIAVAILRDLLGRDTGGLSSEARSELLRSTFKDLIGSAIQPVLVLDEAHLLGVEGLLALKHVWDSHTLFKSLAIILVGQMPLADRLRADPAVRELAIRARVVALPKLTGADVAAYLGWRFARVGSDAARLFTPAACASLAVRGEHPLAINNLAVASLRKALELGDDQVDAPHVGRA